MNTLDEAIELVKRKLDNPDSVSKEELRKAAADAYDENAAAYAYVEALALAARESAYRAVYWSVYWVELGYYDKASHHVNEYEKLAHKE